MGNQCNPKIQKSSALLFSHSFTFHNVHVFVVVKADSYSNYPLLLLATFHIGHLL